MGIIKKKDIKAYLKAKYGEPRKEVDDDIDASEAKKEIEELVGPDGGELENDKKLNYDSQVSTGDKPQTSSDFEAGAMQHRSWVGYGGTGYSRGSRALRVTETEAKIEAIIEDIVGNQYTNNDLVPSREKILDGKINKFLRSLELDIKEFGAEIILDKLNDKLNNGQ